MRLQISQRKTSQVWREFQSVRSKSAPNNPLKPARSFDSVFDLPVSAGHLTIPDRILAFRHMLQLDREL